MRILMICNYKSQVGGISGQVDMLKKQLTIDGHIVDIFSTKGSIFHRLLLPWKLDNIAINYDVLHIHCCSGFGFFPAMVGICSAKRLHKMVVVTYHGGGAEEFFEKHEKLVKAYLTKTDANIVLNDFLAQVFTKKNILYTIVPNILDLKDGVYRKRDDIKPDYICIRSHETTYNIPCILRAFKHVQEQMPEATLTLVGGGSLHNHMISLSKQLGLRHVTFTGKVDNKDIYQYLDNADIMLSSPVVDNMPMSLFEGMNAGLLIISSKVGGVPYMIKAKESGLLFESNNDSQLAECMVWAIKNQEKAKRIIENAHAEAEKYCWDSVKEKLMAIYNAR